MGSVLTIDNMFALKLHGAADVTWHHDQIKLLNLARAEANSSDDCGGGLAPFMFVGDARAY